MCEFLHHNYLDYCGAGGIQELTEEERTNPELFYHNNTHDLKYEGMNVKLILAFMERRKPKPMGRQAHSHIFESIMMRFSLEPKKPKKGSRLITMKKWRNS
jgi:hypothetical protein